MVIFGFKSDQTQSDAFSSVPSLVDTLVNAQTQAVSAASVLKDSTITVLGDIAAVAALDPTNQYVPSADISTMQVAVAAIGTGAADTSGQLSTINLASLRGQLSDNVSSANSPRHIAMLCALSLLLFCTLFLVYLALADAHCWPALAPSRYAVCRGTMWVVAVCAVWAVLVAWCAAAGLLGLSLVMADFCVRPTPNLLAAMSTLRAPLTVYYLQCDYDPTVVNPLTANLVSMEVAYNVTLAALADAQASVDSCAGCNCASDIPTCTSVNASLATVRADMGTLRTNMGRDLNGDGVYDVGLLATVSCKAINGKYQAVLNTLCDTGFRAVVSSFETFIAFACFVAVAEFLRRKYPRPGHASKVAPAADRTPTPTSAVDAAPSYPLLRAREPPVGAYPYARRPLGSSSV